MTLKPTLTENSFKYKSKFGFTKHRNLDTLNRYITLINESLNVKITSYPNWKATIKSLKDFLNENDFAEYEGSVVNDETINQFIKILLNENITPTTENEELNILENKNDELNFLPDNKLSKMSEPIDWSLGYNQQLGQIEPEVATPRKNRGRVGLQDNEELFKFVASKSHQDIVRSNKFMPGQFDIWNANPKGGNGKYYGAYEDIDDDGINEYVVRRGNSTGPRIAVNGYTTKLSDWPVRKEFYVKYPTRAQRKGHTIREFVNEDYFHPVYATNQMDIERFEGVDPRTLDYKGKYNLHISKKQNPQRSPYRALMAIIVNPAVKEALNEVCSGDKDAIKALRNSLKDPLGGAILETHIMSHVYDNLIKERVIQQLQNSGDYNKLKTTFIQNKTTKNPNYNIGKIDEKYSTEYDEFIRSIMNKSNVKTVVKAFVAQILSDQETTNQVKAAVKTAVIQLINTYTQ